MKIGVFVGSFDPIHIGHINVMDYLIENHYVEKIIILPTLSYWDKKIETDIDKRCEMLKKIKRDYLIVDNKNNRFEHTYEVLENIKKDYPKDELYLIISADNIIEFDKWNYYEEILLKYKVIVLNRNNINIKDYTEKFEHKENFIIIQDYPFINISSTKLREHLDKNYLDRDVYQYIVENNLYNI